MRAPIAGLLGRPARAKQLPARERERKKKYQFRGFLIDAIKFQAFEILFFLFHAGILQSILAWIFHILGFHCCNSCCLLKRARLLIFALTNLFCSVASPLLLKRAITSALYKKHLFVVNGNGNDGGNNRARDTREIFKLCPVRCSKSRSTIDRSIVRSPRRKRKIGETRPVCRRGSILMKHELLLLER